MPVRGQQRLASDVKLQAARAPRMILTWAGLIVAGSRFMMLTSSWWLRAMLIARQDPWADHSPDRRARPQTSPPSKPMRAGAPFAIAFEPTVPETATDVLAEGAAAGRRRQGLRSAGRARRRRPPCTTLWLWSAHPGDLVGGMADVEDGDLQFVVQPPPDRAQDLLLAAARRWSRPAARIVHQPHARGALASARAIAPRWCSPGVARPPSLGQQRERPSARPPRG